MKKEQMDYEIQKETIKLQRQQLKQQQQRTILFQKLVDQGMPRLDKYLQAKLHLIDKPKTRWTIIGFLLILFVAVIGTGFLVYVGKMDDGNFTFLLGTLIGASITLLGDIVLPNE